ncbi:MAG: PKD domain-containing protein [Solirubrobacteraceae bacterium]
MKSSLLAALALLLAAPAAALADTTTVDPGATGTCARGAMCKTVNAAIDVSMASDTVKVKAGTYPENVNADVAQVTLAGDAGAFITGAGAGTPLTVSAAGVTVDGLAVVKTAGTEVALSATGGGLELTDATVASFSGPAMTVTAGSDNLIQRSTLFSVGDALHLNVGGAGERRVTVDSSVVASTSAKAVRVTTAANSGDAFLTLNHVTSSTGGITLDGVDGVLTPGDITAVINSSIIHGTSTADAFAGMPPLPVPAPNTVTATYDKSDATAMTVTGGATTAGSGMVTPDAELFAENQRLKSTAPVIDKGGALATGESTTDIDGDQRIIGSASDIGADEYVNHAPTLTSELSATNVKTGETVTATGKATDADGKSDIAAYGVDWGDGTKDSSSSAQIAHAYAKPGTYEVTMAVADKQGAITAAPKQTVTVTDGTPPQVQITSPKDKARVKLSGRQAKALAVKGVASDNVALNGVEVALTRRTGGCAHYDGKTFVKGACKKPTFVPATLTGFRFRLDTARLKFKRGAYEIRVRATDSAGNVSAAAAKAAKSLVAFKVI